MMNTIFFLGNVIKFIFSDKGFNLIITIATFGIAIASFITARKALKFSETLTKKTIARDRYDKTFEEFLFILTYADARTSYINMLRENQTDPTKEHYQNKGGDMYIDIIELVEKFKYKSVLYLEESVQKKAESILKEYSEALEKYGLESENFTPNFRKEIIKLYEKNIPI